jgi:hypothetical protein
LIGRPSRAPAAARALHAGFSPDVSSTFSYLILTVIGLLVTRREIVERLGLAGGGGDYAASGMTQRLGLASVCIVIPLPQAWMSDKTGAISDSSLFAAIIVAFSYDQITAAKDSRTRIPSAGRQGIRNKRGREPGARRRPRR